MFDNTCGEQRSGTVRATLMASSGESSPVVADRGGLTPIAWPALPLGSLVRRSELQRSRAPGARSAPAGCLSPIAAPNLLSFAFPSSDRSSSPALCDAPREHYSPREDCAVSSALGSSLVPGSGWAARRNGRCSVGFSDAGGWRASVSQSAAAVGGVVSRCQVALFGPLPLRPWIVASPVFPETRFLRRDSLDTGKKVH